jgi:Sec-independent protein translocase protein TatA
MIEDLLRPQHALVILPIVLVVLIRKKLPEGLWALGSKAILKLTAL